MVTICDFFPRGLQKHDGDRYNLLRKSIGKSGVILCHGTRLIREGRCCKREADVSVRFAVGIRRLCRFSALRYGTVCFGRWVPNFRI